MDFLVPKDTDCEPQVVVFHLLIPMGYVESMPFFCTATEKIKDTDNNTIQKKGNAPVHPLYNLAETPPGNQNKTKKKR